MRKTINLLRCVLLVRLSPALNALLCAMFLSACLKEVPCICRHVRQQALRLGRPDSLGPPSGHRADGNFGSRRKMTKQEIEIDSNLYSVIHSRKAILNGMLWV